MNIPKAFSIKGAGNYLPETVIASSEIESELNFPEGYIFKQIGIKNRYSSKENSNTYMAKQALSNALKDAYISIKDVGHLIGASATSDYIIPNGASLSKNAFEEALDLDFPCIDINTVCTSSIDALDYASLILSSKDYQHSAIVCSESSLSGLNPNDSETYSLFGDGAAAVIISRTNQKCGLIQYKSKTNSEASEYTIIEGWRNISHTKISPYDPTMYSFKMQGKKLLKNVQTTLPKFLPPFFKPLTLSLQDVNLIVLYKESKLGNRMLIGLNKNNSANLVVQLENHGNYIAASQPIALVSSIESKTFKEGDTCFPLGAAARMTIGGLLFKFSKL
jgi:3-oxoacyl-[acyl-carrier-protein] synthase-3